VRAISTCRDASARTWIGLRSRLAVLTSSSSTSVSHTACGAHNYHLRYTAWYLTNPCFYHIVFTNAMEQSPSEAGSSSASKEAPRILCNPNVHCRTHNNSPLFPILNQVNPVHNSPVYLFKIHFNIINNHLRIALPSDLRLFPTKTLYAFLFHACYIRRSSYPPCFDCHKNI